MIAIIDYGAGNLRSVERAIAKVGGHAVITSDARVIREADGVVLPGVGAAADTMYNLRKLDLVGTIGEVIAEGKPFFGICMGLQVLFTLSEEGGRHECLNVTPGVVRRFPQGLKVPHMGWNQVEWVRPHPLFEGVPSGTNFYFVHSYFGTPEDDSVAVGRTEYQVTFTSAIARDNLVATQFHPEKSGAWGLVVYRNFCRMVGEL